MTRRERLEMKLEKRLLWAESRETKAAAAWEKGDLSEAKSGIPFGQPILVGHHSEGRHRRTVERAHAATAAAIEHKHMAEHHAAKASGIESQLDRSIFSDDENALEALQERIAGLEAERAKNTKINRILHQNPKNIKTDEKVAAILALGLSEFTANKLFEPDFAGRIGIPAYVNSNLSGRITAARKRLTVIQRQQERHAAAEASETGVHVKYTGDGVYAIITFAEKPSRDILNALREAGYYWGQGCWTGQTEKIPDTVKALCTTPEGV